MRDRISYCSNDELFKMAYGDAEDSSIHSERRIRPNEQVTVGKAMAQWEKDYFISKDIEALYSKWAGSRVTVREK